MGNPKQATFAQYLEAIQHNMHTSSALHDGGTYFTAVFYHLAEDIGVDRSWALFHQFRTQQIQLRAQSHQMGWRAFQDLNIESKYFNRNDPNEAQGSFIGAAYELILFFREQHPDYLPKVQELLERRWS